MKLSNVKPMNCFTVYGDLSGFDILVEVRYSQTEKAEEIVQKAFEEWFEDDSSDATMCEYIYDRLLENEIECRIYATEGE